MSPLTVHDKSARPAGGKVGPQRPSSSQHGEPMPDNQAGTPQGGQAMGMLA